MSTIKVRGLVALAALGVWSAASTEAGITFFTDRAVWQGAAGSASFSEDFSGFLADTAFRATPLALSGMAIQQEGTERMAWNEVDVPSFQFTPNSGGNAGLILTNFPEGGSAGIQVRIAFTGLNTAFGLNSWSANDGEGVIIEVYSGGTLLGSQALTGSDGSFLGYVLTQGATATSVRVRSDRLVEGMGGERFYIDHLAGTTAAAQPDTWVKKADMPTPRQVNTVAVNGRIYAIGGAATGGGAGALTAVEEYDPVANSWASKTDMPAARYLFASGAVNGKIYAIGGDPSFLSSPMTAVHEYDPVTDTWTDKADMPTARSGCVGAVVDGKIYVIGGLTTRGAPGLPTVEVYDPATDSWEQKADMPTPRGMLCASVVDGKIFAIGSSLPPNGPWLSTVEMYDPLTDVWTRKADMPTARGNLASSTANGKIYVMGGRDGNTVFANVEEYDPVTDVWQRRADMWSTDPLVASGRLGLGASEVNGRIYAIGGVATLSNAQGLSSVLEYTPPGGGISKPTLSARTVGRNSVTFEITDGSDTTLDGLTVVVKIDGAMAPTVMSKVGKVSRFTHTPSTPYAFGSVHLYEVTGKDNFGNSLLFTGQFTQPTPWFPDANLPSPAVVDGMWASRYIFDTGIIDSIPSTLAAIQATSMPDFTGLFADATSPVLNHGNGGLFLDLLAYADEAIALGCCGDDFIMLSVAHLEVLEEGDYTFGIHSDDGFGLRIRGGTARSVSGRGEIDPADPEAVVHPANTPDSSTRAVYHLKAGVFRIEFFWWENKFGDFGEIYVAKGVFPNDADTATWKLVGEVIPGLGLTDDPVGPVSPSSIETINTVAVAGVNLVITFKPAEATKTYRLAKTTDFETWNTLPDAPTPLGGNLVFTIGAEENTFYRVIRQ